MYCNSVSESYNSENAIIKFFHSSPEAHSGITLNFDAERIFDNLNAPFFLQIRALTQNLMLEISSVFVLRHALNVLAHFLLSHHED